MAAPIISTPEYFVGREEELRRLARALSATVSSGRPQFVLIHGDVGAGKTFLVEAFLAGLSARSPAPLIGQGRCALETERNGLVPFSQVLRGLAEHTGQLRLSGGVAWDFVKEVAPAWINLLTMGAAEPIAKTVEAGSKLLSQHKYGEDSVFTQFTNAITQLAKDRPVVIFIDDLHWADESSLRLLFHLQRNLDGGAVLFLCTYRAQIVAGASANVQVFNEVRANLIRSGATEIELNRGIHVPDYIAKRYPQNTFGAELVERIQAATEGHPLFVDQLFDLWESTGVICSSPSSADQQPVWQVAYGAEVAINIPPALSEVLGLRLHIMEESLRNSLVYAAVEGPEFAAQVVARLRQLDELTVFDDLEALERDYHLIQEQAPRTMGAHDLDYYRFGQRFIREYVYRQLPSGKRRILHRQVGESLESLCAEGDLQEVASQLAWHFGEAHEPRKAARYALLAAAREQKRYAWTEAEKWCAYGLQQLSLAQEDAQIKALRLDLLEMSAAGGYWSGAYTLAHQRYSDALALAQELPASAERIADLWAHLADLLEGEGQYDATSQAVERGLQVLKQAGAPFSETTVRLRWIQELMQGRFGNEATAMDMIRGLLADVHSLPMTPTLTHLVARIHNSLGVTLFELGDCREALNVYRRGLDIADKNGDLALSATIWLNSANPCIMMCDAAQAQVCIEKGRALAQRVGDRDSSIFAEAQEAEVALLLGRPQEAVDKLTVAMGEARKAGALWNMAHMNSVFALACNALGETDRARAAAERGLALATQQNYQLEMGVAHDALGQILMADGDWTAAAQHLAQAVGIHRSGGQRANLAFAERHWAEALREGGCETEARALLTESLATLRELHLAVEASATERLLM